MDNIYVVQDLIIKDITYQKIKIKNFDEEYYNNDVKH